MLEELEDFVIGFGLAFVDGLVDSPNIIPNKSFELLVLFVSSCSSDNNVLSEAFISILNFIIIYKYKYK